MSNSIDRAVAFLLPRLTERSTVLGFLSMLGVLVGYAVAPERLGAIATAITFLASFGLVVTKEAPPAGNGG